MTSLTPEDQRSARLKLCSRAHADRVAFQLCDTTAAAIAVVRTGNALQPYRVMPAETAPGHLTELEVRVY